MKALLVHTLVTLVIVALALVGYDRFVRRPAARVGLIDVGEVVRLKDARVLDVLTRAAATEAEKKAAIDFGTRFTAVFPQALEELTQECDCLVLDEPKKRLLNSLRTEPGVFSEMYVYSPMGEGVARLILDPYTLLLFSNRHEDNMAIDLRRARGMSIDQAIADVLRERGVAA